MTKKLNCLLLAVFGIAMSVFAVGCDDAEKADVSEKAAVASDKKGEVSLVAVDQPGVKKEAEELAVNDPAVLALLPDVIAKINGKDVTKTDFITFLSKVMPNGKFTPGLTKDMLATILPKMVQEYAELTAVVNAAEKAGFKATPDTIKKLYIEKIAQMPAQEKAKMEEILKQENKTIESYIDEVANSEFMQMNFAIQQFQFAKQKEIFESITIAPEEVEKYYNEHKEEFVENGDEPGSIRASHILIKTEKGASAKEIADAKAKAEEVLAKVKANPDKFAEIAAAESACPSKEQGGSLGAFSKGQMVPEFEKAAFALKEGEISDLVVTDFGFHIIKRDKVQAATILPFEKIKDQLAQMLKIQQTESKFTEFMNKVIEDSKIEILVKAKTPETPVVPAPENK